MRPRPVAWLAMAKERLKSPRARLFVALDLPEELRDGIVAWGRQELRDPALRPVPRGVAARHACLPRLPAREGDRAPGGDRRRRSRLRRRRSSWAIRSPSPRCKAATALRAAGRSRPEPSSCRRAGGEARRRAALQAREAPVLAARDGRPGQVRGSGVEAAADGREAARAAAAETLERPHRCVR